MHLQIFLNETRIYMYIASIDMISKYTCTSTMHLQIFLNETRIYMYIASIDMINKHHSTVHVLYFNNRY